MSWTVPTHAELSPASAAGHSDNAVQQLVDEAFAELGRGIGLDDADLEAVAYSSQPGVVDAVRRESILRRSTTAKVANWLEGLGIRSSRGPLRLPANRGLGMRERVCLPVRSEGELLGFLWILDSPDPLSEEEVAIAFGYAARISIVLAHDRLLERRERAIESELVRQLVAGEVPPHHVPYGLLAADTLVVSVVRLIEPAEGGRPATALEWVIQDYRRALPPHHVLTGVDADEATVILAGDDTEIAAALEARLVPLLPAGRSRIGVGGVCTSATELERAHREARLAALAAIRLPELGPVVRWSSLGAYRTLLPMIDSRPAPAIVPEPLLRLREADGAETLVPTLETYLETAGDAKATAAALSLHRSSLYLRLRRIEEITALDLRSGDDRLNLHLGLRMLRLLPAGEAA
jgi:hypothetical protein